MPRKLPLSLLTTVILTSAPALLATSARATPIMVTGAQPHGPDPERRTEIDLGLLLGGSDVAEEQRRTYGLHLNVGRRFGDLAVLGEYDYLALGKGDGDTRGAMNRAGLIARYSLLRTSSKPDRHGRRGPLSGDFWFEGGAGVQRLAWHAGGTLTRPDVALGFGWQLNGVIGRRTESPRYYGPYIAFRALVSRAPEDMDAGPAICAGPCDSATRPPKTDVSMFVHLGVNWSR